MDLTHTDAVRAPSTGFRLGPPSFENPVMIRELRSRMRGARSYVIILVYALTVSTFVLAAYAWLSTERATAETNRLAAEMGRAIWMWGCASQACLLPLLVPGFTCGASSSGPPRPPTSCSARTLSFERWRRLRV